MRPVAFSAFVLLLFSAALLSCSAEPATPGSGDSTPPAPTGRSDEDLQKLAEKLAQDLLIVDTHVDAPYAQVDTPADISVLAEERNFDFPKARAGGLNVPFMSIYVPASFQKDGGAKKVADDLIDMVEGWVQDAPDKFAIARFTTDIEPQSARNLISLPMGMENGAPIEGDLDNLRHFHQRGIRYITLTHSENNHICDSSYAKERQWNGLSPFGREVVAEMNRLGIMVDTSHISDASFDQVLEITRAPVIASHSSARHFTPGFERNLDDDRIRRLGENGGVLMINFGSSFLSEAAQKQSGEFWGQLGAYLAENNLKRGSEEATAWQEEYWSTREKAWATLEDVADHIDHVVKLVGVDHVGFGSDFDGVGDSLPEGLKDVSGYPNLIRELLSRGYSEEDIGKICGANLMRVWTRVEEIAAELQGQG